MIRAALHLLRALPRALERRLCSHEMFLEDLTPRDAAGIVRCPCHKCGTVLQAEYGIALPGRWMGFRKHRSHA